MTATGRAQSSHTEQLHPAAVPPTRTMSVREPPGDESHAHLLGADKWWLTEGSTWKEKKKHLPSSDFGDLDNGAGRQGALDGGVQRLS